MSTTFPIGEVKVSPVNPRPLDPNNLSDEDEAKIEELRQSIAEHGILQPPIGRRENGHIGLAVGQRRLVAARRAGLKEIPVELRDLDDAAMLRLALTEQLQRVKLHPLDEAAAYEELVGSPGLAQAGTIAALGISIGKSPEYIRGRLQLRRLAPKAEAAFRAGDLDLTRAFYLARIPSTKVQEQLLGKALEKDAIGDQPSARQVLAVIHQSHTFDLMKASFDAEDASLVPGCGGSDGRCSSCPSNTATTPELFDDVKAGPLGVCTDENGFRAKTNAAFDRAAVAAKTTGKFAKVLDAKQSASVFDPWGSPKHDSGYVRLEDKRWDATSNKETTYRKIIAAELKSGAIKPVLAKGPDGSAVELITRKAVEGVVHRETQSPKAKAAREKAADENRATKADHDFERELAGRLIVDCVKAAATKGGDAIALRLAMRAIVFELDDEVAAAIAVRDAADARARAAKLTLPQLRQVIIAGALYNSDSLIGGELRPELLEACKLLGVDAKATRKGLLDARRQYPATDVGGVAVRRADLEKRIAANSSKPRKPSSKKKAKR